MTIDKVLITQVKMNVSNPRTIKDDKFKKLVKSIKSFPEMLEVRPIVVDDNMVVLGGNMRLKACIEAGLKEVHIIKFNNLDEDKKKEFIVKDNIGYGEWDWEILDTDYNKDLLLEWGLDFVDDKDSDDVYTRKIETPIYEPKNKKPDISELFNDDKVMELVKEINESNISENEKMFLIKAACRHNIFDYSKIADYYAHSDKDVQNLMEKSALVIIDFDKAIANGYIKLTDEIKEMFKLDYE